MIRWLKVLDWRVSVGLSIDFYRVQWCFNDFKYSSDICIHVTQDPDRESEKDRKVDANIGYN